MISFIVIGRNEEKNLERCIKGIHNAASYAGIGDYEIIYVDSRSTDRSIEVVQQFPDVKIFLVTGHCNAAIGRNIGAREAKGDVLFFIDADMEIYGEFLAGVWDANLNTINENFVSGMLIDIIEKEKVRRSSNTMIPGGIYIIKRELWDAVGGMRNKFRAGEDYDLGLRLIEKGYRFKRKTDIITNHYTVPMMDKSRAWKAVWNKYSFYPRCVVLRNHLFTKEMYIMLWKNDKTFILLILAILLAIFYPVGGLIAAGIYLLGVLVRSFQNTKFLPFFELVGYYILTDILNLVYFFTFFPKEKKEEYVAIRHIPVT
mgnify:CR=1 FL=1